MIQIITALLFSMTNELLALSLSLPGERERWLIHVNAAYLNDSEWLLLYEWFR